MQSYLLLLCGLLFALQNQLGSVMGFGVGVGGNQKMVASAPRILTAVSSSDDTEFSRPTTAPPLHQPPDAPHHRRDVLSRIGKGTILAGLATTLLSPNNHEAQAAPPIAVIAEELGYFPVQTKAGDLVYVPKRVQRQSSDQAIELAKKMSEKGAVMYGACK